MRAGILGSRAHPSGLDLQTQLWQLLFTMFSQRNRDLHKAIVEGNYDEVIQALDVGPKRERKKVVDQAELNGATPLTRAAGLGYNRIVLALLDRGAAIDQANYGGQSPLYVACSRRRYDTAELLIVRGANIELMSRDSNPRTPLQVACQLGHTDVVRLLLDRGADIDRRDGFYRTPLQGACQYRKTKVVQLLLDREAKINDLTLFYACSGGGVAVVRCLLARGLSVTPQSREAARNKPAIKALLDAAAPARMRQLAYWINRIHLRVVGPRGGHQGSARHQVLNCRHLARHLVSFLPQWPSQMELSDEIDSE